MNKITNRICCQNEMYELMDIPRPFDERLYRKYGISDTVISYWKDIGFTPAYTHLFWLIQGKEIDSFTEWMDDKASLLEGMKQENKKLGEVAGVYCRAEKKALDWMLASDSQYIYYLKASFDDGFEEPVIMSSDFDDVKKRMGEEINKDTESNSPINPEYHIDRYRIGKDDKGAIKIDLSETLGRLIYNKERMLTDMQILRTYDRGGIETDSVLSAYIFLPHPFKKGDAVSFWKYGERIYGVISFPCEDRTGEQRLDDSDFTATIEVICEVEGENRFAIGHEHICPVYLEKAKASLKNGDGPNPGMLYAMRQIISGESVSLNELSYYMDKGIENTRF